MLHKREGYEERRLVRTGVENNRANLGANVAKGVDVAHDVMPKLGFLLSGVVPVNVVDLGTHLLELLVRDVQP